MENFKKEIIAVLKPLVQLSEKELEQQIAVPPEHKMGNYSFPCFILSKAWKRSPQEISAVLSEKVTEKMERGSWIKEVRSVGPYLNFFCDREKLAEETLQGIFHSKEKYGYCEEGRGKNVVIDFSAPNIAKPFGIGHLRSTVIGSSLYRLYKALGYNCVGINHLGDWGTQFGKLMVAYRLWGSEDSIKKDPITYLYELYVKFHKEADEDPLLEEEGRKWFKKLEDGEEEAVNLWSNFRELSLREFNRIYKRLDITFDAEQGESFYNEMLSTTIDDLTEHKLTLESEGALIVDLEPFGMPPCLLRKKDGATLYATRDLCAAIYRYQKHQFHRLIYVVGAAQSLHFQQFFKVLELMEFPWAQRCVHVPFGLIKFKEGKMSTRMGNLIFLEDVIDKAVELAKQIIEEKNPNLQNKEQVAEMIGIGAIIFGDLSNDRIKDIDFDWDKVLDFSGETSPYIQYSHARICSILRKEKVSISNEINFSLLQTEEEQNLILGLARFSENIKKAAEIYKPSILARYLIELTRDFNIFYHRCPVLTAEDGLREARLLLVDGVRQILVNGLYLLGIKAPSEM
ncbi:arginine--tRNA ligase [Candidatus Contubernalis alkaliaceticus]|uniref:arginine--tRNA ligase n=1 Tax=Candidatus Contubernalis alkaliaceticus TaxID=338645 RepID=UPI001F4BCE2F|nr:arginine--tRNA ligase [Candidatus Contubernalis alkalaceticus]UNC90636.1 arginine--tRNA ligase [Candidatus Contubernalis alkalaceticus]